MDIDALCRLCRNKNETTYHLLSECEASGNTQLDILNNIIKPLPDMKWSLRKNKNGRTNN